MLSDNSLNEQQISAREETSIALLEAVREAAVQSKHTNAAGNTQTYAQAARELAEAFSAMYRA